MTEQSKSDKLHDFLRDICVSLFGCIRALSLYPADHPETGKKLGILFQRLNKYLSYRPSITLLFLSGEIVVENIRVPELSTILAKVIQRIEKMKLQRLVFRRGLTCSELLLFLQLMPSLLKNPSDADLVLARNQERLPHIIAGGLPFDSGTQVSYEELSSVLKTARESLLSFSGQLKDVFADLHGPLSSARVSEARETVENILQMNTSGELPLKVLIYRRSSDPDPFLHAINVCSLTMGLSRHLELAEAVVKEIGLGALLHDVGLHFSPSVSLSKSSAITLDDRKKHWEHPVRGAEILLASPGIPDVIPVMTYEHHIHYDGSGYPRHEEPRELNMASLLLCITDTYDSLRRNRPEQAALNLTQALNWMDQRIGLNFHPILFKQFRALVKGLAKEDI